MRAMATTTTPYFTKPAGGIPGAKASSPVDTGSTGRTDTATKSARSLGDVVAGRQGGTGFERRIEEVRIAHYDEVVEGPYLAWHVASEENGLLVEIDPLTTEGHQSAIRDLFRADGVSVRFALATLPWDPPADVVKCVDVNQNWIYTEGQRFGVYGISMGYKNVKIRSARPVTDAFKAAVRERFRAVGIDVSFHSSTQYS